MCSASFTHVCWAGTGNRDNMHSVCRIQIALVNDSVCRSQKRFPIMTRPVTVLSYAWVYY